MTEPLIVDAHLDIAWNVLHNHRDLTKPVADIRALEARSKDIAMTSLHEFSHGGVGLVFATLYAEPADQGFAAAFIAQAGVQPNGYHTPEEAERMALEHLAVYERWADAGLVRIITSRATLEDHLQRFPTDRTPGLVILMEGADPIKTPNDLGFWWDRGVRIIGLTWGRTRYAGGTGAPGGLTEIGRELLIAMRERGVIWDASHIADQAFWEGLELGHHALIASHSNPRAMLEPPPGVNATLPADRHLTDEMIRAIGQANGVIGLNLINPFLEPRWTIEDHSATVSIHDQCKRILEHNAALIGWDKLGLGSDIDAGSGCEQVPIELDTIRDFRKFADIVPESARAGVLGENWIRLLQRALP